MENNPWLCNRNEEPIVFSKTTEAYGEFGNMCKGYPITFNNTTYKSSEHFYQAMRFTDPEHIKAICDEPNAYLAKQKCRELLSQGFGTIQEEWDKTKVDTMFFILRLKFDQHPKLRKMLEETYTKPLVEYSTKDRFWGAEIVDDKWVGKNTLGKLLMRLRWEYLQQQKLVLSDNS